MRAPYLASVLVLGWASVLGAQAPSLGLEAGGFGLLATRGAVLSGSVGRASGFMAGAEAAVRASGVNLRARLLSGSLDPDSGTAAAAELTSAEAMLGLGPRAFQVEGGYVRRAVTGSFATTVYSFYRAGARLVLEIGATGVSAVVSGAAYFGAGGAAERAEGKVAETALRFARSGLPIFLTVGYRFEQITVDGEAGSRPEELSGIVFGGGLKLGR